MGRDAICYVGRSLRRAGKVTLGGSADSYHMCPHWDESADELPVVLYVSPVTLVGTRNGRGVGGSSEQSSFDVSRFESARDPR